MSGEKDSGLQLNILIRLLALGVIEGKKQREQIHLLSMAGLDRNEIAALVGTTPGTVSKELSIAKRGRTKIKPDSAD